MSPRAATAGRVAGVMLGAVWIGPYLRDPERYTLLDEAILVFHEAGHVLFLPFGEFLTVLGGTLFQVMVPTFFILYFAIRQRDPYAACMAGFFLVPSLFNAARYIADARAGELPLLSGDRTSHDWTWLLIEMELLDRDLSIGRFVRNVGITAYWLTVGGALYFAFHRPHPATTPAAADARQEGQVRDSWQTD